ncbi:hypothetical protein BH10BDE1_BH10BDE1_29020 [soil metagenome]
MKNVVKSFQALPVLSFLFVLSACGNNAGPPAVGHFSKPTEVAIKMQTCAQTKLSTPRPVVGEDIRVCRRDEAGKVIATTVTPSFYAFGKEKRIRVAQVIGVTLSFAGAAPDADLTNTYENTVNDFLMAKCQPQFRTIFRRSGLIGSFIFQTFLKTDRLVGRSEIIGGAVGDREELFGSDQAKKIVSNDPKKQIGVDRTRISPNVRLNLVLGSDEGVTIKDAVTPVGSGPLKKLANEEQQNLFCAQVLVRIGENMGLGALPPDDMSCVEPAEVDSTEAATTKSETAKGEPVVSTKPLVKSSENGIMKAGSVAPKNFATVKLSASELKNLLEPVCGSLETLPKDAKTSQK